MRLLLLSLYIFAGLTAWGQMRMIPHLTRADGGFQSQVILANTKDFPAKYRFIAYDETGTELGDAAGQIAPQTTAFLDIAQLFGTDAVSHFVIDETTTVSVTLSYIAGLGEAGPAHLDESNVQSPAWRLYAGDPAITWDGIAYINTGSAPARVTLRQVDENGAFLNSLTLNQALAPNGKGLYVLGTDFDPGAGSIFELSADQPLALTALRGNQASTFLWRNAAAPFSPAPSRATFALENAFSNLSFNSPVDLQAPDDDSNRLFVVLLDGLIQVFDNDAVVTQTKTFLDIRTLVSAGGEMGLLGLAFHPDYRGNGYFFVNYTTAKNGPRRSVIARYQVSADDPDAANPASGLILLEAEQPFSNHNGGQLAFGPDGYLYIALGDGGSGGDPERNGQDRSTLLGSLLRIDVGQPADGLNYRIPPTNPYAAGDNGFRREIYAYGLRNPWRFSFDVTASGTRLWVADVGQDHIEEINLVEAGKNYGWNIAEGNDCFSPPSGCNQDGLEPPLFHYSHENGDQSITGGHVYRGSRVPALQGAYVYADFWSGRIWALQYDGANSPVNTPLLQFGELLLVSFGVDQQDELFACALDGKIYRLVQK